MSDDTSFSAHPLAPSDAPPTRVRHLVLAYLCALSFILYVDRICISKAAPQIQAELGLSNTAMGYVFAAFTVAYGLFEVPTGRWGDRHGSRGVLTRIVLWWSLFTALTGAATGLYVLLVVRFLFGAGEAGALPNAARVIARWYPAGSRGPAQGIINTSALLGGVLAPIAATYLIELVGWRWSFVLFGLLGVVWAAAFYFWFRDDPAEHPAINGAERDLIRGGSAKGFADAHAAGDLHPPVPWGRVLTSPTVWLLGGVITCSAFASYLFFFWYPSYLEQARGVTSREAGWLSGLVLAGGALGSLSGGFLSDWLVRRTGNRRWSRRAAGCSGLGGAALMLLLSVRFEEPALSALCASAGFFCSSATLASWWAVVTDISGRHLGALFGLMNSLGVPGAMLSQLFVGNFADWMKGRGYVGRAQWDPAFYVYAVVLGVGACGWLLIDADRPVAAEESEAIRQASSSGEQSGKQSGEQSGERPA